jgi:predicted nucleic acid-binding protein
VKSQVTGRLMTDAAIVAICREHAVGTMLSAHRDFARSHSA